MADSNYAALGQGLKLYTDSMRRLVKERLVATFPNSWWESGVLAALTSGQKNGLNRELARYPDKDRLEFIDASHLVRIVAHNFDKVFAALFGDYRQSQSFLNQVVSARNEWAHPRTGDMPSDDVGYALYAMEKLLSAAKLPEAAEVEALRKEVLGIPSVPAPVEPEPSQPARRSQLPYWWEVCEPHDGFQNPAFIDESLFAATLGGVFAGAAREEYLRPDLFLSHTYFTENLKQTVRDIASRLNGGGGPSVTEMQTPFGGGKTHALLTLYHLINTPKESLAVPGVREALGDFSIPSKARVLVFDGHEHGTEPMVKQNTASVSTIWGELTFQVGTGLYQKLMMDADSRGEAPGNALFRQVLEAASPCLILIDELVSYLVKLRYSNSRRTQNLYRQTVQFIQETLQLAGNVPGVCVLMSLPKSVREFGGLDPEQLQRELAILEDDLQPRADRVVSKRTPVDDEEIYLLMSKRLFKKVDKSAAERVAQAYRETYARTPNLYDDSVFSAEYLKQQIAAYPLHPELIDLLYKKWSTASDFPRTRAVLQLLANIVADQWVSRREGYAIQSAHVNLERERIRTRIVSAAGAGGGYTEVVASDIIGGDAHADMQDQRRGREYARHQVARGVATTLLMHSFGGQARVGAHAAELRLGTVAPNLGPEYVSEVLGSLEESLWYVHRDGERLRFQTKRNIYRVIAETAKDQPAFGVQERLRAEMAHAQGSFEGFRVLPWAATEGTIPDNPEPSVAILNPKYAVTDSDSGSGLAGREPIDQLWDRAGGGFRNWRNSLILVAPDRELWARAEDAMREVMAYEAVIASADKKSMEISQLELNDLKTRYKDKKDSLRTSITTAYRWVFHPDETGLEEVSLPVPATANERISGRVVGRLAGQDYGNPKVLQKIGAVYFNSKIAPRLWQDESGPLELGAMSRRFPQWTFLPILPKREETLRGCIREGVSQRLWAVVVGDNATFTYQQLIEIPEKLDQLATLFDGSASLVKGDFLELIRESLAKDVDADEKRPGDVEPPGPEGQRDGPGSKTTDIIPSPPKRYSRVRLRIDDLRIAKTSNLQPYLFRVIQEQDAGADLAVTIEVNSGAGIPAEVLDRSIVEAFDQLGITIRWEEA